MYTSEIRSQLESNPNAFMPVKWDQLNSDKILKEISLDNEEALKNIKNQLTEIKISTSKNTSLMPSGSGLGAPNQKSTLSSTEDDLLHRANANKPIIADNLNKFNKNKSTKSKGTPVAFNGLTRFLFF